MPLASTSEHWWVNEYEEITESVMELVNIQSACVHWVTWLQDSRIKQNMFYFVQESCTRKILLQVAMADMQVSGTSVTGITLTQILTNDKIITM